MENTESKNPKKGAVIEDVETIVYQLSWEESERGWGTRPAGYSLHITVADCEAFIRDFWDEMPDSTPDEYERPAGEPYRVFIDSSSELYKRIEDSENGIRIHKKERLNPVSRNEVSGWWQAWEELENK